MKIGIDASRANQQQKTGVGNYAYNIIQELKQIIPAEVQVVLYSKSELQGNLSDLPKNWESEVLSWGVKYLWTQVRLSWEMLINPPDVLFIPSHVFPIIHPEKTVMTVHDIAAARFPESYNFFEKWYSLWSAKWACKNLWKVITPSNFVREELVNHFDLGNKKKKINSIHHGYNKDRLSDVDSSYKALGKYNIQKPFLLVLGRIEHKKNILGAVQAFEKLKQNSEFSDMNLVLAGKPGHGYDGIKKNIKISNFSESIIETGWIDDSDIASLISKSKLVLFPSFYEGFGLPMLESFFCKTPVVASKGTALEEVGGNAAIYCNPKDIEDIQNKIEKILSDEGLYRKKIKLGKQKLSEFDWKSSVQKTAKVLLSK